LLIPQKSESEVAHHAGKTLGKDVTAAFQGLLALLATLGTLQFIEKLLELIDIKVVFGARLTGGDGTSHF
jgi:hypothetical protein